MNRLVLGKARLTWLPSIVALAALLTQVPSMAQGTPDLVKGKSFIDVPAISNSLCVNNIFQSDMVLQRNKTIAIFGWASPGERVVVSFGNHSAKTTASKDRTWKVRLPALKANGKGQTLTVKTNDKTIALHDVLIGDVWVLGGQSNMEEPLRYIFNGDLEIASSNFPQIRYITIPKLDGPEHRKGFPKQYRWNAWSNQHVKEGYWEVCSPKTVSTLSAIGYVFARRIYMATKVPIGIIDTSRGGTTVEAWVPRKVLDSIKGAATRKHLKEWDKKVAAYDPKKDLAERVKRHRSWLARTKKNNPEEWRHLSNEKKRDPTDLRKGPSVDQNRPGNCYASIIAPLEGFGVKGAIFHQGYNNCFQWTRGSKMYRQIFGPMITAWRAAFDDPQMAFGIISQCSGGRPQNDSNCIGSIRDAAMEIREAQYKTFLDFQKKGDKNVGFASSFDIRGSWYHPQIKIPVGERIARWALATQYGMNLKWEPPTLAKMTVEADRIVLRFSTDVETYNEGPFHGFIIAGADKKFQKADARYLTVTDGSGTKRRDRKSIVLTSPMVPKPVHFRYAWARNPQTNVIVRGIPLATQRSDKWTLEDLYEAYSGKKTKSGPLDRGEHSLLQRSLDAADIERQLFEARALLKRHTPKVEAGSR